MRWGLLRGRGQARSSGHRGSKPKNALTRLLKTVVFALVFAFLIGFTVGLWIRAQTERPVRHIGGHVSAISTPVTT